jgi:hypothetical protein
LKIFFALAALLFFLSLLAPTKAKAEPNQETCEILARNLKPDLLLQGSSSEKFSQLQQLVKDNRFDDWGNVSTSSSSSSLGFSIPEEVDLAIDDNQHSDSANWGSRRSQFLSMNFQQTGASFRNSTRLDKTSVSVVHEIVDCATKIADTNSLGFVAILEKITDDRRSFAVKLAFKTGGNPNWALKGFDVRPHDPDFNCTGGWEKAARAHPIKLDELTQEIVCSKNSNASLLLAVNTTAGAAPAIQLTSVREEVKALREEMNQKYEGLRAATSQQIQALQKRTDDQIKAVELATKQKVELVRGDLDPALARIKSLSFISANPGGVFITAGNALYSFPPNGNLNVQLTNFGIGCFSMNQPDDFKPDARCFH